MDAEVDPQGLEVDERVESVLFLEKDEFRLVIRGFGLFEEILDDAIGAAFRDGLPDELSRLRLPARLALAQALELITPEVGRAIKALAKIRNEFAHA